MGAKHLILNKNSERLEQLYIAALDKPLISYHSCIKYSFIYMEVSIVYTNNKTIYDSASHKYLLIESQDFWGR